MSGTTGRTDIIDNSSGELADTKPVVPLERTVVEETPLATPVLRVAQRSDVGVVRQRNEDSCLVFKADNAGHTPLPIFGLFIVADGMGGHESGHLASKVASRVAARHVLENIYLPLLAIGVPPGEEIVQGLLQQAVQEAHQAIYNPDPAHDGGTTLTMALCLERQLYVAHVGDTRAYWLVDEQLEPISVDHSLVQRLQDEGQLTPEEAEHFQYRNILLRALGQEDDLEVDTYVRKLPRRGKLLLCSDGLCGLVHHDKLQRIMREPIAPGRIAEQLIVAGIEAGGYDNITAVVVDFQF